MSLQDIRFWLREPTVQFWCVVVAAVAWALFVVTR